MSDRPRVAIDLTEEEETFLRSLDVTMKAGVTRALKILMAIQKEEL